MRIWRCSGQISSLKIFFLKNKPENPIENKRIVFGSGTALALSNSIPKAILQKTLV